jgi:hypothetical protein
MRRCGGGRDSWNWCRHDLVPLRKFLLSFIDRSFGVRCFASCFILLDLLL